jgi:Short C-terminal domain
VGYLLKSILGAALFVGGTVVFNVKLVELLEVGTCASGNQPFEIARECPEGTGAAIGLMVGSIFAGLIGAALFAFRGDPPWGDGRGNRLMSAFSWGTFAWGTFFSASGAAILIASRSSESMPADGELGGTIVGITFLVMGVPAVLFAVWSLVTSLGDRDERPATASASGLGSLGGFGGRTSSMSDMMRGAQSALGTFGSPGATSSASGGDSVSKLERLQRLRESGALTEEEFQREKAKVLSGM